MKKFLTIFLALTMIFGLCACGSSDGSGDTTPDTAAAGLQVGYSRIDLTPSYKVHLTGYSDDENRVSEGFRTQIFMTCIAVRSGEDTFLLYTVDALSASRAVQNKMREAITNAVDIPEDNIFIGATHCHSTPALTSSYEGNDVYYRDFVTASATSAQEAIADLTPATMLAATPTITDENGKYMNFVRHYEMSDGTHAGSNFGDFSKQIVGHSAESDPQAVLVKFDREGDKKDVLMVNFQAHPDRGSELGRYLIAASWVGPLRDELEKLSGMEVAYFTGASGNQNADSKIAAEAHNLDWIGYGTKLGQIFNEKLSELQPVEGTELKQTKVVLDLKIDHSWDHMLEQANEVYDLWKSAGKTAGDTLGKTYNFSSSFQARAIRTRAAKPATEEMETRAFRIGSIGFTTGTYEMFSTHGLYVKRNSPFDITFIISGNSSYLPDVPAYEYRSYEADTGMYAPGEAEVLAENYVEMLKSIK